jgi:hypothetical protein
MIIISQEQHKALKRLKERVQGKKYELRIVLVHATALMPGYCSVTTRTPELYDRVVKLVRRILPEVQLSYETGIGWHTGDRTQYHFGSFDYMLS